jgi:ABC-2 type transport system ATP-binding protein
MIEIQQVSKSYSSSKHKAVDDLNLSVKPGEIFGFLGPNGAGKTTTIKMLVGLLRPDSGSIRINGFDITTQPLEAKRQFAYVPDNPDLYDKLTGLEYLNFVGDIYGVPGADRQARITEFATRFDLTGALSDRIGSYSHGMQQKLAVIGALLHNPPVWILDEPLIGLDPRSAHDMKEMLAEHTRQGNIVFFSTHILEVAEKLCDRVAIINKGRIIACGTMAELRHGQTGESLEQIFLELTGA